MRRTDEGTAVIRVHYSADPAHTPEWAAEIRKSFTSEAMWRQEMEIEYEALTGQRVYPEFDIGKHVIADEHIPTVGCRYMSIDPHPRTPHAMLWVLIDSWSDWYVYRELWPSVYYGRPEVPEDTIRDYEFTVKEYSETVASLEKNDFEWKNGGTDRESGMHRRTRNGERIIYRFMDQAGKGFRASGDGQIVETYADKYQRFGIHCIDPVKAHDTGEDAIHDLLKSRNHQVYGTWPRLHIARSCPELILELQKHRYKKKSANNFVERELRQDAVESRTHMVDNLRYLATGQINYNRALES